MSFECVWQRGSETTCVTLPPLRPACDSRGQQQLARVCPPQHTGRTWQTQSLSLAAGRCSRATGADRGPTDSPPAKAHPVKQAGAPIHPSSHSTSPAACPKRRCEGSNEPLKPSKRPAQGAVPQAPPRAAQLGTQGGNPGPTPGRRQAEPRAQQAAPHCLSEHHQQRQGKGIALRAAPRAEQDSPRPRAQGLKGSPRGLESVLGTRASKDTSRLKGSCKHESVCLAPVIEQLWPWHKLLAQQAAFR